MHFKNLKRVHQKSVHTSKFDKNLTRSGCGANASTLTVATRTPLVHSPSLDTQRTSKVNTHLNNEVKLIRGLVRSHHYSTRCQFFRILHH